MSEFTRYVPRLVLDWAAEASERRHRSIEGSLVFIDISGFTKMSERLARKGKVGAEEVSEAIDTCFGELLQVAHGFGGSLLKFGGDALLLLFDGLEHSARAVRAAWDMRQALRRVGKLETSAGKVTLRMSCGIHSGKLQFFLVGQSHKELLVTGSGSTRVAQMESVAGSGEILLSPASVDLLCQPTCIGSAKGPGYLLKRPPMIRSFTPPQLPRFEGDASDFVPSAIRQLMRAGIEEGEHRLVTVGFIHFGGVDELLETGHLEQVGIGLEDLVSHVQSVVDEEGIAFLATDIYPDGGKLILTAGAPLSSGNDEERMLRSLTRIREQRTDFPMRMGAFRGHVFSGEIGSPFRKTYTVMGDAVNMAARLMERASEGQIVTTEEVTSRSRTKFAIVALEPFTPKGKSSPVTPQALQGRLQPYWSRDNAETPLIGRQEEMQQLLSLAEDSSRRGVTVQILGEAGVGKSRLLQELPRLLDLQALIVSCEQYEENTPYFVIRKLVEGLLHIQEGTDPKKRGETLMLATEENASHLLPWIALVASLLGADVPSTPEVKGLEDRYKAARLSSVLVDLIGALMPSGILGVEDAHWMDAASTSVFNGLATNPANRLVILTRRYVDRGFQPNKDSDVRSLQLVPLPRGDIKRIVRELDTNRSLLEHEVDFFASKADGNPLFARELVEARQQHGHLEELPGSIEALVSSRIDRLPSWDKTALRYASLLGSSFDPELLSFVMPDLGTDIWDRLGSFVERDVDSKIHFRSDMYRQAAYEGLSFRSRRRFHSEVADLLRLKRPPVGPEVLSTHFHLAQRFDESWKYSRIAAKQAWSKWALNEASKFYERALEAGSKVQASDSEISSLWEQFGICLIAAGRFDDAGKALASGRRFASDSVRQVAMILRLGELSRLSGDPKRAIRWYSKGLKELSGCEGPEAARLRVRCLLGRALVNQDQGDFRGSIKILEAAEREARESSDDAGLGHVFHYLHIAYMQLGDPKKKDYRGLAVPIYKKAKDRVQLGWALNAIGTDFYHEGRWDQARAYYEKSRRVRESSGDSLGQAVAANNIAEILSDQGHLKEALALFEEALSIWRPARFEVGTAFATGNIGRVLTRKGELEAGLDRLTEALDRFDRLGARSHAFETKARIAENRTLAADFEEAQRFLSDLRPATSERGREGARLTAMTLRLESARLASEGMLDDAYKSLSESIESAREWNIRFELAQSLRERARLSPELGLDPKRDQAEADRLFKKLGVIAVVELPISATASTK